MQELTATVDQYLENCRNIRRLSAHTVEAYKYDLAQFISEVPSKKPLTAALVRACLTRIVKDPGSSPATAKRKFATIRAFLRATNEKLAARTFGSWTLNIRAAVRLPKAVTRSELSTLLATSRGSKSRRKRKDETTHICLTVLTATGLRVSELCALNVCDVRLDTGEIKVFGKGARERIVMMVNRQVREAVSSYIEMLPASSDASLALFRNRRGRRMTPQCLRLRLRSLVRRSSLTRRVTPHMLRHTAATLLLEGGVDIRFVQRLLGHASISTTQIYTHVTDMALRCALQQADVMRTLV